MKAKRYIPLVSALMLLTCLPMPVQARDYGTWNLVDDKSKTTFVKDGEWVLTGTEDLKSFVADAGIPTDPMGVWQLVDFRIDKAWVDDEQVSSEFVSHTRIGAWKKIGDAAEYDEVLKSSPKTYGKESVVYVNIAPRADERETRVSPNGAYTYQIQKYRRMKEKTVTKPYHLVYTYAERVKHTCTFLADFEDVSRITFYNPVTKTTDSVELKVKTTDTMVTPTGFVETGKLRIVSLNDKEIVKEVIPGDGYEEGQEIPGTRVSNAGKTRAAMSIGSRAFSSNSQSGHGAGKVSYTGARERLAIGIDKIQPSAVRDTRELVSNSFVQDLNGMADAAKDPAKLDNLTRQLADLTARAGRSNLTADQAAKVKLVIGLVNKQIASTKAAIAAKKAAQKAAEEAAKQAKKDAEAAAKQDKRDK